MEPVTLLSEGDLPDLARLYGELIDSPTDLIAMRASFKRINADPNYTLVGIRDDAGRLVGSALGILCHDIIGQCRPWMAVENVIVSAAARGNGVGRQLMSALEGVARSSGCSYVALTSSITRREAHAFYRSIGYSDAGEVAFRTYL